MNVAGIALVFACLGFAALALRSAAVRVEDEADASIDAGATPPPARAFEPPLEASATVSAVRAAPGEISRHRPVCREEGAYPRTRSAETSFLAHAAGGAVDARLASRFVDAKSGANGGDSRVPNVVARNMAGRYVFRSEAPAPETEPGTPPPSEVPALDVEFNAADDAEPLEDAKPVETVTEPKETSPSRPAADELPVSALLAWPKPRPRGYREDPQA